MRVLVVDDDLDLAMTVAMFLRIRGHEVEEAHDGSSALQKIRQFQPQVAVLDIGLPDIDGFEVAATIRRDTSGHQPRLVALTGRREPNDRERARQAGFDEYLIKPMQPQSLLQAIGPDLDR